MADFTQTIDYPSFSLGEVDVRAAFRNVVGSRMRRGMDRIAQEAANNTPFDTIASAYSVVQETVGDQLVFEIRNADPHFAFVEEDMPAHAIPPVQAPIAPFLVWGEAVGANPYAAREKVAMFGFEHPGTKGRHMLEYAWDDGIGQLEGSIEEGLDLLVERWGAA